MFIAFYVAFTDDPEYFLGPSMLRQVGNEKAF